jgi:hypothetical protein
MADSFLTDVEIYRNAPAYSRILKSPSLGIMVYGKAQEVVRLYQARVGKKTGRLAASAEAKVRMGGQSNDRIIGVASINDSSVQAEWKGKPFYYGVYHEQGTLNSKRARRRNPDGARGPRPGYYELRRAAQQWRGSPNP